MSNAQSPPPRVKTSGFTSWFILGLALFGMAIILIFMGKGLLFDVRELPDLGGESAAVNKTLPDLDLMPINAIKNPVSLEDLSGRVVLINFWATWCPPCQDELPEIAEIGDKFKDDSDFLLLPVSCGDDNQFQLLTDSLQLLRQLDLDMPCYADPNGVTRQAFASVVGTNRLSLPTTLILDRKGVIRGVWIGFRPGQNKKIQELITSLLAEKTE